MLPTSSKCFLVYSMLYACRALVLTCEADAGEGNMTPRTSKPKDWTSRCSLSKAVYKSRSKAPGISGSYPEDKYLEINALPHFSHDGGGDGAKLRRVYERS